MLDHRLQTECVSESSGVEFSVERCALMTAARATSLLTLCIDVGSSPQYTGCMLSEAS